MATWYDDDYTEEENDNELDAYYNEEEYEELELENEEIDDMHEDDEESDAY